MANIDYINALGAGASFDTKSIVESLVQAERAGSEAQIQRKLASAEAKISGLGAATSILNILKEGAEKARAVAAPVLRSVRGAVGIKGF